MLFMMNRFGSKQKNRMIGLSLISSISLLTLLIQMSLTLAFSGPCNCCNGKCPPAWDIDCLIDQVNTAWTLYDPKKINRIFLTHQMVCQCILENEDGSNDFQLPHVNKKSMEREGKLPKSLPVSARALSVVGTI